MSAVQLKEVVEALLDADTPKSVALAKYVEQHGIAPPDGRTPVAWAIDMPYGRAYSFADEVIGKWIVEIDANGCSTHPKARHGFARQASHSEGEYVCECDGFDPYEAGYQDGIRAAWDANGTLLPDGMVLVPKEPTSRMLDVLGTTVNNSWNRGEWYANLIAAAPKVSK